MLYILTPLFCVGLCLGTVFLTQKTDKITASAAVAVNQSTFTGSKVGVYSKANENPTNVSYNTVAASTSTAGTLSFTGGSGTMSASSSKKANALSYVGYISFEAEIVVPANTEYKVTYEFALSIKTANSGGSSAQTMTEILYFGNSENGGSNQTSSLIFECGKSSCASTYRLGSLSGPVYSGSTTVSTPEITYTNNTNEPLICTAYFGYNSANNYNGKVSTMTVVSKLSLNKETVIATELSAPTVDVSTTRYDGENHNFTFTYDKLRVGLTKAEYTDTSGAKTTTYDKASSTGVSPLDTNDVMTAKDAGTYTLYFDIADNCGAVWDTATNDQTTKSVSFTITPIVLSTPVGTTVTADYSNKALTVNNANSVPSWYDNIIYTDTNILTLSPATVTEANESGYTVTATIVSNNYVWSDKVSNSSAVRTFTYKVNRKVLDIEFEDKDGLQVAKLKDESQIFSGDKDGAGKPTFTLKTKYYEAGSSPSSAVDAPTGIGNWIAMAVIEGEGSQNYKVDATQPFTFKKRQIAYPVAISASGEYDGTSQEFTFTGFDANKMSYTAPDGADSFDGETLMVTNAGKYTPVYTLKDSTLYEFIGTPPSVVITSKAVMVRADGDNATEWQRGTDTALKFDVPTALCGSDTTLKFDVTYTLNGGSAVNANKNNIAVDGKNCTVTVPKSFAKGKYALTVKVADGENYSGSCTYNFEITAQGLTLDANDIKWTIDGNTYRTDNYDNAVFEMEYTGNPLNLNNVKVDFSDAPDAVYLEQDGDLTGIFIDAVNVGEYDVTFKIKAISSDQTCSDGPFTLKIKIIPKVLDFTNAEWEYSNDGGATWNKITANSKPSYTGDPVSVRISPEYMEGLGLKEGDYTATYTPLNDPTEQGEKTTNVGLNITNSNYTTADESGYVTIPFNWEITAKALTYSWSGTQTLEAGEQAFEIPAIIFDDGNDYSQYFDYVFTVNGKDYTLAELQEYIAENWTETTPVNGTVRVQLKDGVEEVNIVSGSRNFSTGTPKTALDVELTGGGVEYGKVDFALSVVRGTANESGRTEVTVTGGTLSAAKTFNGNDPELVRFVNGLNAGSYNISVTLKAGQESSYLLNKSEFKFEVLKCNVQLPTVREIVFTGEIINLVDYLDGFDANLMKLIGAAEGEDGIVTGRDYRKNGYFTTIALIDGANYQFVKPTEASGTETVKATLKFAVAFTDTYEVLGSEYEYNWMIQRFRITEDMWEKSGKQGISLKLPSQFAAMLADENLLKISYSYYDDRNGAALEEYTFKGGNSFWANATLTGEEANNFEFENGLQISDKTVYTVPQSKTEAFFNNTVKFIQNNLALVIGCAVGLLLLILLIIIIACTARSRKKKREREALEEQRRLEKEEREREERRLEREERMARLSQQQAAPQPQYIPQPMPQMMPQMQMPMSQPMAQQGGMAMGGSMDNAQLAQMQAELAAVKAEQSAMRAEQNAVMRSDMNALRNDYMFDRSSGKVSLGAGMSAETLAEIVSAAVEKVLDKREKPAAQTAQQSESAATPASTQVPPDAVMTTVTTTKIDTTKKPVQSTNDRTPVGRPIVRNYVAPMPVDDGRVFDVGGFYKPADPVTDLGLTDDEYKKD